MIFTKDYIASIRNPGNPFERKYIFLLSTHPYLKHLRERIDLIFTKYPEEKRSTLINKIKSENDIDCFSAISELFVFEILNDNFEQVDVETPLPIINNATPDFWVDNSIAFEVATIFNIDDPFESEIYEAFNQIHSNFRTIIYEINNPSHIQPTISEIKNEFQKLINSNSELSIGDYKDFEIIVKNNIRIIGKLFKSGKNKNTVVGTSMSYDYSKEQTILYENRIRNRIREKLLKYGKLTKKGIPFVAVIYDRTDLYFDKFWQELIFTGNNKIFNPNFNTSLTALLIKDYDTGYNYKLAKNPYARQKLGTLEEKIKAAFTTRELI